MLSPFARGLLRFALGAPAPQGKRTNSVAGEGAGGPGKRINCVAEGGIALGTPAPSPASGA